MGSFFSTEKAPPAQSSLKVNIRPAKRSDLERIATIAIAAFQSDPQWPWRFPNAKQYPDDHFHYTKLRFGEYLDNADLGAVTAMVAEIPSIEDPKKLEIGAFGLWQMPGFHLQGDESENRPKLKPPTDNLGRPDANPVRMKKFRACISEAKGKWFNAKYGEKQITLVNLATHPDYWRRGLASELCRWGLEKAKAEDLEVTLFSSPMGLPLYTKLGFHEVGILHCQVEGEEESIDLPGMEWGPLGENSSVT